ncbi:Membrane-bound oxidoreductase, NuoK subunit [Thermofilum adornatum 1505]|uniref:Membrane-bound oxidoreductase, NuoK subunit n=1 Tax=Thermofilum adornatum 1505 TaxID=697581 RepID=A0A3G1A5Z0_9CREN|nr:NADH-quinone oxidoreductase subunit NuoK [Thermofilum adornatum]AJB41468.1 Membrane-bound oxidoreductase, NuoK subunit [Thermofilum adornatum 1505]
MNDLIFLVVSSMLFSIGLVGAVIHRSAVRVMISLEIMFNGVLLALLTLSKYFNPLGGSILALYAIALSSVEVGVLISVFILLYRRSKSLDVYEIVGLGE